MHAVTISYAGVEDPFKVQNTPMDFNVTANEKPTDMVSDSTKQWAFKKLPVVKFWCSIQKEYPQLFLKGIKTFLPFLTTYICGTAFSLDIIQSK